MPLLPIGTLHRDGDDERLPDARSAAGSSWKSRRALTLDFTLDLAGVTTEVTVISEAQVVHLQRSDASLGQLINAQQVAELPLNGRNFVQLALLGPGTVTGRAGSFLAQGPTSEVSYRGSMSVSAQGMRENANDWLYDGVDDNELSAGGVGILPNIDSIREFKVLTHNYLAQYGSRGGTTVLVSSKAGENSFHGSAFEFFRNDALDARNFFDGATRSGRGTRTPMAARSAGRSSGTRRSSSPASRATTSTRG